MADTRDKTAKLIEELRWHEAERLEIASKLAAMHPQHVCNSWLCPTMMLAEQELRASPIMADRIADYLTRLASALRAAEARAEKAEALASRLTERYQDNNDTDDGLPEMLAYIGRRIVEVAATGGLYDNAFICVDEAQHKFTVDAGLFVKLADDNAELRERAECVVDHEADNAALRERAERAEKERSLLLFGYPIDYNCPPPPYEACTDCGRRMVYNDARSDTPASMCPACVLRVVDRIGPEIAALRARVEEAEKLLRPFAEKGNDLAGCDDDVVLINWRFDLHPPPGSLTVGHLRAARAFLAAAPASEPSHEADKKRSPRTQCLAMLDVLQGPFMATGEHGAMCCLKQKGHDGEHEAYGGKRWAAAPASGEKEPSNG